MMAPPSSFSIIGGCCGRRGLWRFGRLQIRGQRMKYKPRAPAPKDPETGTPIGSPWSFYRLLPSPSPPSPKSLGPKSQDRPRRGQARKGQRGQALSPAPVGRPSLSLEAISLGATKGNAMDSPNPPTRKESLGNLRDPQETKIAWPLHSWVNTPLCQAFLPFTSIFAILHLRNF